MSHVASEDQVTDKIIKMTLNHTFIILKIR